MDIIPVSCMMWSCEHHTFLLMSILWYFFRQWTGKTRERFQGFYTNYLKCKYLYYLPTLATTFSPLVLLCYHLLLFVQCAIVHSSQLHLGQDGCQIKRLLQVISNPSYFWLSQSCVFWIDEVITELILIWIPRSFVIKVVLYRIPCPKHRISSLL